MFHREAQGFTKKLFNMNTILQNILVFLSLGIAVAFLVRKFIWKPNKADASNCGSGDDCGCR